MKKSKQKFETNTFYHFANEHRKRITDESELEMIDFTETFWKELGTMISKGELINMNINAPPTSGKSITGMAIANRLMKEYFGRELKVTDIELDRDWET